MDAYRVALSATSGAAMDGADLVVPRGIELPRLCAKCGATKKLARLAHPFASVPVVLYAAFFLASPIFFVILYVALRRQASVTLSLCKACERTTLDAKALRRLTVVGGLALFIGVLTAAFNGATITAAIISLAGALIAIPAMRYARRRDLWAAYIGPRHVILRGVHPAAAQATIEATTPVT